MTAKVYLTPEEAEAVENAALYLRDKLLIRMFRRMAGRVSEILGIEEQNIDFDQRLIKIVHEKARITRYCPFCAQSDIRTRLGKKWVACPKCLHPISKTIKDQMDEILLRDVPIDKDTLNLIQKYIKAGGVTEVQGYIKRGGKTELVTKRMLFNITRQRAWRIVVDCAERAGINELVNPKHNRRHHVHPHSFRDSFITDVMKRNPSADETRLLQEIVGHQNFDTTAGYRKVENDDVRSFYDKIISGKKIGTKQPGGSINKNRRSK